MGATSFDTLDFYEKLVKAGFNDSQARIFANCMRTQSEANAAALRDYAEKQEKRAREELASKTDIANARLEMARMEARLIQWMLGVDISSLIILAGLMAKGFGWR